MTKASTMKPQFRLANLNFKQMFAQPAASPTLTRHFELQGELMPALFGKVLKARRLCDGQMVAIKVLQKKLVRQHKSVSGVVVNERPEVEMAVLKKSARNPNQHVLSATNATTDHHPLIVLHDDEAIYNITPFCDRGELLHHIKNDGPAPIEDAVSLFKGIVDGVQHTHSVLGYVHNDISPENILLKSSSGSFSPVLTDFGLATPIGFPARNVSGKAQYQAPEVLHCRTERVAHASSDVFSLGVVFFVTLTGQMPYTCSSEAKCTQFAAIQKGARAYGAMIAGWGKACRRLSKNTKLLGLICRMLSADPRKRPTLDCVLSALDALDVLDVPKQRTTPNSSPVGSSSRCTRPARPELHRRKRARLGTGDCCSITQSDKGSQVLNLFADVRNDFDFGSQSVPEVGAMLWEQDLAQCRKNLQSPPEQLDVDPMKWKEDEAPNWMLEMQPPSQKRECSLDVDVDLYVASQIDEELVCLGSSMERVDALTWHSGF